VWGHGLTDRAGPALTNAVIRAACPFVPDACSSFDCVPLVVEGPVRMLCGRFPSPSGEEGPRYAMCFSLLLTID